MFFSLHFLRDRHLPSHSSPPNRVLPFEEYCILSIFATHLTMDSGRSSIFLVLFLWAGLAVRDAKAESCSRDRDCGSTGYCHFGTCKNRVSNGRGCALINGDRECRSTHCSFGKCVACSDDRHCSRSQYCKNNLCRNKKTDEATCSVINGDRECLSGHCKVIAFVSSKCAECTSDSHCGEGNYCFNTVVPECKPLERPGTGCTEGRVCASGECGRCSPFGGCRCQFFGIKTCC